jgi:hypothetical protein
VKWKPLKCVFVISIAVIFYIQLFVVQAKAEQLFDVLTKSSKLIESKVVLEDIMGGSETTRVIVTMSEPPNFQQKRELEPARPDNSRSLKNLAFRTELKRAVKAAQDQLISPLSPGKVKITNRFSYIFGFSAEVTLEGLKALEEIDEVISISKDRILEAHLAQGIPLMSASTVRNTYNGSGIAIAICDTGIDYTHPWLGGGGFPNSKVIGGYDTGDDDFDPIDYQGHGTNCAGIAAGGLGTVGDYIGGVAHNAKLYAVKISYGTSGSAYTSDMIEGWEWCITHQNDDPANPIMVVSTSFGGGYHTSNCDFAVPAMTAAAQNAVSVGITLFVSSGNGGRTNGMGWPACISHVNSVGAVYDDDIGSYFSSSCTDFTTAPDQVTCYSNSAPFLTLFAPSNHAYSTDIRGSGGYDTSDYYPSFGGTSAACPYSAGSAACLQSAAKAITGSFLTPAEVRSSLTGTGDLVTDPKVPSITKPRINLQSAVDGIGSFIDRDLAYTPVTPCRIVDTRLAGGAIPPGGIRSYNVRGAVASQGGNPSGCPSPKGEPYTAHINVTVVPLGNGNIVAYPFGSPAPNASLVNYRSDAQNVANSATVKTCNNCSKDINIKSNNGTAHVIIDVLGYDFNKP